MRLLDSNVLLRILLRDDDNHARAALDLIFSHSKGEEQLGLLPTTFSEVLYVLSGPRLRLSYEALLEAIDFMLGLPIVIIDEVIINDAVDAFRNHHHDWDDCLLAAYAIHLAAGNVASFDRGFDRIPGVRRTDPLDAHTA